MLQRTLGVKRETISSEKLSEFNDVLNSIYSKLRSKIPDGIRFDNIIKDQVLHREDSPEHERPESLTEETVIIPLLEFLGFEENISYYRYTGSRESQNECDVTLIVGDQRVLVESEPLNKNLYLKGVGFKQIENYLSRGEFRSEIGLATNGFLWILGKYDQELKSLKPLKTIDIRPLFRQMQELPVITDLEAIKSDFYDTFAYSNLISSVKGNELIFTIAKERVSKNFYEDYVRYVFGLDENGEHSYCLLDGIKPKKLPDPTKRSFAVTIMNRLIFIKFLEDKVLENQNLLLDLVKHFELQREKIPQLSFYNTYLKPLFYGVFNRSMQSREKGINDFYLFRDIPYLNGGLFREIIPDEASFTINNDILTRIIKELLVGYSFNVSLPSKDIKNDDGSLEKALDPDILGYVFEKTINYLTSPEKRERRKIRGAYYTPEDITSYITTNTIEPTLLTAFKEALTESNWNQSDISRFRNIGDVIKSQAFHVDTFNCIIRKFDNIKILDPACGSGHFLTSALKMLVMVLKNLYESSNIEYELYDLKRRIISRNLYGIDIEEAAVEITKLRLWLALIEELERKDIVSINTLPNIEYNIVQGNSLLGWHLEKFEWNLSRQQRDEKIDSIIDNLEVAYSKVPDKASLLSRAKALLSEQFINLDSFSNAYGYLKEVYVTEMGEQAVRLKSALEIVKSRIYGVISPIFEEYINTIHVKGKKRGNEIKWLNVNTPVHWPVEFNEVTNKGGFDVIIGNPPYGASIGKIEKEYLVSRFPTSKNNGNSAMMFIERCYELLSNTGKLGLVVPKSLSYAQHWENGRIFSVKDLANVFDVSKAFKDVKLEQIIIRIDKGINSSEYLIGRNDNPLNINIAKSVCLETGTLILWGDKEDLQIFRKMIKSAKFFKDISYTKRGLAFQSRLSAIKKDYPALRGVNIHKYRYDDPSEYIDSNDLIGHEIDVSMMRENTKIVSQRIVAHVKKPLPHLILMSALDKKGMLSVDTVENTYIIDKRYDPELLVHILNSSIASWYAYRYVFSNAVRTMDFDDYYVKKIPLPKLKDLRALKENLKDFDLDLSLAEDRKVMDHLICSVYGLSKIEEERVLSDFYSSKRKSQKKL